VGIGGEGRGGEGRGGEGGSGSNTDPPPPAEQKNHWTNQFDLPGTFYSSLSLSLGHHYKKRNHSWKTIVGNELKSGLGIN
jgi:hypothetical protein